MKNQKDFEGKTLIVLGAGESGVGAAVLGESLGMKVFVSDNGPISDKYRAIMLRRGILFEENGHSRKRVLGADYIVKSPGIPPTAPLVKEAEEAGIPILSEIEFAGWFTDAKMVCITGSNGKTTTTMLTYHILTKAGLNVGLAGNVGKSLALQVAEEPHDVYVIELSSFQLENMYEFKANIAVILNITPDHMDRYDHKMENYTKAKFRIARNQQADDYFVYWLGDPIVTEQVKALQTEARLMPFSDTYEEESVAWEDENGIVHFDIPGENWDIPRDRISLPGRHNLYNSMAAGISASLLSIKSNTIKEALGDFEAVEHRLEFVRDLDGVHWINDSKATNVNSTWYALDSMRTPVVLILGGKDKGNDYSEILPLVKEKVKAIVCMGKDNAKLMDFFSNEVKEIRDCHSLIEAVAACRELATEGDTVLLSPCCASFDLFSSYEDRGRKFKDAVNEL
ncbi:MAG: UDP-N-acetylmuramoyl-L-alanine--D-glutamate ligase [Muribaculaceae bacterium]|nr:UDP-N-acetylmuramoyl-L-alanine--D-glutamate ligase [Muribaculaceae bacterium]MDE6523908.1 UDP-N-acetylmuramoyl-L-alanine--D-glutamate ligase [Muribaculaceae bacterium]